MGQKEKTMIKNMTRQEAEELRDEIIKRGEATPCIVIGFNGGYILSSHPYTCRCGKCQYFGIDGKWVYY